MAEKIKTIAGELELKIKALISKDSDEKFFSDVRKIGKYLNKDVKYIVLLLFLQIGTPEGKPELNKVFEFTNQNDVKIYLQLKIKSYIPFINQGSAERYIQEELTSDDLATIFEVKDGVIVIE